MRKFWWFFFFEGDAIKTEQTYFKRIAFCHYLRVAILMRIVTKTKHDSKCKCIASTVTKAEIHFSNIFQCTTHDLAHLKKTVLNDTKMNIFAFFYKKITCRPFEIFEPEPPRTHISLLNEAVQPPKANVLVSKVKSISLSILPKTPGEVSGNNYKWNG